MNQITHPNHKPFYAVATLISPTILSGSFLTLDGLLAAARFQECEDPAIAISDIPLTRSGRIWHGSQAYFEQGETGRAPFTRRMAGADIEFGAWVPEKPKLKSAYAFRNDKDDYRNVMSEYTTIDSRLVLWFGHGDIERVSELLNTIHGIGAKRAQGYGEVQEGSWEIQEMADDCSHIFNGEPARPVPVDMWREKFSHEAANGARTLMTPIDLPTWKSKPELCAVPPRRVVRSVRDLVGS